MRYISQASGILQKEDFFSPCRNGNIDCCFLSTWGVGWRSLALKLLTSCDLSQSNIFSELLSNKLISNVVKWSLSINSDLPALSPKIPRYYRISDMEGKANSFNPTCTWTRRSLKTCPPEQRVSSLGLKASEEEFTISQGSPTAG